MKSATQPNFDMENSKIELIFPIFSSSSLFLPRLVKNVFKRGQKCLKKMGQIFFPSIFIKIAT